MDDVAYGNWDAEWITFLVGATFATALYVLIVGMLFVWGIKALRA